MVGGVVFGLEQRRGPVGIEVGGSDGWEEDRMVTEGETVGSGKRGKRGGELSPGHGVPVVVVR